MSREEVIANIGTIAKSGTCELRERTKKGDSPRMLAEFIRQFRVGFYSAFMASEGIGKAPGPDILRINLREVKEDELE